MKKGKKIEKIVLSMIFAIVMMAIGVAIATAVYSGGVELKVPKVTITWETVEHDLWLQHYTTTDSMSTATSTR